MVVVCTADAGVLCASSCLKYEEFRTVGEPGTGGTGRFTGLFMAVLFKFKLVVFMKKAGAELQGRPTKNVCFASCERAEVKSHCFRLCTSRERRDLLYKIFLESAGNITAKRNK